VDDHRTTLDEGQAIAITNVYAPDGEDFCVAILERPVMFGSEIVPGIPLNKLNVIDTQLNEMHIETALNETPIVIGYGLTGVPEVLGINIIGSLEDTVGNGKLQERQNLLMSLGWNIKKAIRLRGIDLAGTLRGCRCKQWDMGKDPQYAYSMAGGGFSGSLVVRRNGDGYDVYGIYSGPLWKQNVKDFVMNAVRRYLGVSQ
jgi:hypothetical protein